MDKVFIQTVSYSRDSKGKVVERHLKPLSNTLHTGGGSTMSYLFLPQVLRMERTEEEKLRRHKHGEKGAKFSAAKAYVPRTDSISNTITSALKDNLLMVYTDEKRGLTIDFAVRKFTPRDCFRLMDVSEEDIDKIQAAGISNTQQYKMAGNSIVVSCLYHIFRKMFVDTSGRTLPNLFGEMPCALPENIYNADNKLRVVTAFSGYDSQCMGLDRIKSAYPGFDYDLVAWSEIDKYAIQAHNAVYPQWADRNLGDISKIDWSEVDDFDLFTYSFPCTDVSSAGLQKGLSEGSGTRSGLLWECRRAIETKKPKFLLMENVKALTQKKFMPEFQKWQDYLTEQGYKNFWKVLNSKDYGVPQNRERVFMVSILTDEDITYHFPTPFKLTRFLGDVIEKEVDDKYYVKDKRLENLKFSETFLDRLAEEYGKERQN